MKVPGDLESEQPASQLDRVFSNRPHAQQPPAGMFSWKNCSHGLDPAPPPLRVVFPAVTEGWDTQEVTQGSALRDAQLTRQKRREYSRAGGCEATRAEPQGWEFYVFLAGN